MIPAGHLDKQRADAAAFHAEVERVRRGEPAPPVVERADPPSTAGETCGCGTWDCGECGPRLADGWRPAPGTRARLARQHDAAMTRSAR